MVTATISLSIRMFCLLLNHKLGHTQKLSNTVCYIVNPNLVNLVIPIILAIPFHHPGNFYLIMLIFQFWRSV